MVTPVAPSTAKPGHSHNTDDNSKPCIVENSYENKDGTTSHFPAEAIKIARSLEPYGEYLEKLANNVGIRYSTCTNLINTAVNFSQLCSEIQRPSYKTEEGKEVAILNLYQCIANVPKAICEAFQLNLEDLQKPEIENRPSKFPKMLEDFKIAREGLKEFINLKPIETPKITPTTKLEPVRPQDFWSRKVLLGTAAGLALSAAGIAASILHNKEKSQASTPEDQPPIEQDTTANQWRSKIHNNGTTRGK